MIEEEFREFKDTVNRQLKMLWVIALATAVAVGLL